MEMSLGMSSLSGVWDWSFFWGIFGFFTKFIAPFVMLPVAIICVGLLVGVVINAVRGKRSD